MHVCICLVLLVYLSAIPSADATPGATTGSCNMVSRYDFKCLRPRKGVLINYRKVAINMTEQSDVAMIFIIY